MKLRLLIPILFIIIGNIAIAQKTTDAILDKTFEQAALENKNVLVIFHASWCSWCKKFDQNLNDERIKSSIESNYIITHLTVNESKDKKHLETPGAHMFLSKYNGAKAGLPFWLIFDKDRNLLGNAYGSNGKNMGCPSTKQEVNDLKKTLKKSSNLTNKELNLIQEVFYIKAK